uniref:Right handed beta helix domain-containing protein n=1 Tax=Attheya septentrionalis TaxID=420275 RepID=A0A7S2UJN4_9STRA|mmetsp:Transcript_26333/g.47766  ORF Transcript_26333/g.47766 Transcript_26333/m.47766 type:complete len:379 (+) Transcript_26333:173-1309(+)
MRLSFLLIATAGSWSMAAIQDCFTSTLKIIEAQIENPMSEYIVCPNTSIAVGVPNVDLTGFEKGDWPLLPLGPDVTFKCGLSGKSENNCTLDGSFSHFLSLPSLPQLSIPIINTDNLYVSGFTFTGDGSNKGEGTISVALNAPGINQTFNDIIWKDVQFQTFFAVEETTLVPDEGLLDLSIEVTLQNSKFRNISYGSSVIVVTKQKVTVRNTLFDGVETYDCGCVINFIEANTGVSQSGKWTSTSDTYIDLIDNCFQSVTSGSALMWSITNDTAKVIINKENNYVNDVTLLYDKHVCKKGIAISTAADGSGWEKCLKLADAKTCSLTEATKGSKSGGKSSHEGGNSYVKSGKTTSRKGSNSDKDNNIRMLRKQLSTRV